MSEDTKEQPEVKPEDEVKQNSEEQEPLDKDDSDPEKKEKPNEKGEYDGLRIKLKGLPLNRYVRDTNSLHKIIMDLFVTHLKCGVPKVKAPKITDRWLVLEMASNEDKKKILTTIVNNYKWSTYRLTVRNCEKGAFTFRQPELDEKGETVELSEENVVDVLLKYHKMPYFQQLQTKSQDAKTCITEVIERLKATEPHAANQVLKKQDLFEDIVPSPVIDGYSNDNFFSFVKDKVTNTVHVGIMVHSGGKSVLAPIEKCRQVPRQMMDVIMDLTNKMDNLGLSVFDPETKEGAIGGVGIQMNGSGEMLMSIYAAQSQESSFVPADVMRKKPNRGAQKGAEVTKKEDPIKTVKEEPEPKEETAKEEETKTEESSSVEKVDTIKEEPEDKSEESMKEEVVSEEKKELDESKYEGEILNGGKLTFKKLKEAMASFHEEIGKAMGVKSIYKGTILYGDNGELVEKLISFTFLAGVRSLKEVVNGVEFVLTPSRLLWPNARSFGILASVTERLAKICPSTVVVLACNDQRWLPTYFAKKCKEVLAISTWTTQTCQELLRTSHQKGIHNINYFNCNARIPPPVLKRPDRMVLIVWDHGDESTFKKCLAPGIPYDTFIQIVTYVDKKKMNRLLKPFASSFQKSYLPAKVVPVDVKPLSHSVGVVIQYNPPKKGAHNEKAQKATGKTRPAIKAVRGGWSGGVKRGGGFGRPLRGPGLAPQEQLAVNLLTQQNQATRCLFQTLVDNYVAPPSVDNRGWPESSVQPEGRRRTRGSWRGNRLNPFPGQGNRLMGKRRVRSRSPTHQSRDDHLWQSREAPSDRWEQRRDARRPSPPRKLGAPFGNQWGSGEKERFSGHSGGRFEDSFRKSEAAPPHATVYQPLRMNRDGMETPPQERSAGRPLLSSRGRARNEPSYRGMSPLSHEGPAAFKRTVLPPTRSFHLETFNRRSPVDEGSPRQFGGAFKRHISPEPVSTYEGPPFKRQREGAAYLSEGSFGRETPSYGGSPLEGPGGGRSGGGGEPSTLRFTNSQRGAFPSGGSSSSLWPKSPMSDAVPFGGSKRGRESGGGLDWPSPPPLPPSNAWTQSEEVSRPSPWADVSGANRSMSQGGQWAPRSHPLLPSSHDVRSNSSFASPREPDSSASWYDQVMESQNSQENIFSRLGPSPRRNDSSTVWPWKPTY